MIKHLIDYFERHGRDVRAHARGFDRVNGMANAGCEHFSWPRIVSIDLDDVTQQHKSILANVIKPAEERTDERSPGFCRKNCLSGGEAKRHVDFDTFIRQGV